MRAVVGRSALVLAAVLAFIGTRSDGFPFDPDSTEPVPRRLMKYAEYDSCRDAVSPFDWGYVGVMLNQEPVTPRQTVADTIRRIRDFMSVDWRASGDLYRITPDIYGLIDRGELRGWFRVNETYPNSAVWRVTWWQLC